MTDVLYHPLIDRDTDGLDKSPLFCSPDREKVAGTAALYLEELVPKRYRLIAREEHTTRPASAYRIHCPICGVVMRAISRPSDKHRLSLYESDTGHRHDRHRNQHHPYADRSGFDRKGRAGCFRILHAPGHLQVAARNGFADRRQPRCPRRDFRCEDR